MQIEQVADPLSHEGDVVRPPPSGGRRHDATDLNKRLARLKTRSGVFGQPASHTDIRALRRMLGDRVGEDIASDETAISVQEASPNSIWSLYSQRGLEGGIAFLALNSLGLYKLIYGKLDPLNPGVECLAVRTERPAVLYVWGIASRPKGLAGLADVLQHLGAQRFRDIDIWARPVNQRGERLAERIGMTRVAHGGSVFYKLARGPH